MAECENRPDTAEKFTYWFLIGPERALMEKKNKAFSQNPAFAGSEKTADLMVAIFRLSGIFQPGRLKPGSICLWTLKTEGIGRIRKKIREVGK